MQLKERYVGKFYGFLAENKLVGQRCNACGTYRLFPVPVCSNCQGTDLSWMELAKEGKLLFFSITIIGRSVRFSRFTPCAFGCIELKDGPVFWSLVEGIDLKNPEKELKRLPLDVNIEIREIAGNKVPIAKIRVESERSE